MARVEERTLGWGMREREAHRDKDDVGEPSHWGDPVSLESCRRIDGYLSRLDIGCVLSFDRAERAVILSGGEIEGWGGEVRGKPVKVRS